MTSLTAPSAPEAKSVAVHWGGEPAVETFGPLAALISHIPSFDRRPFGVNPRLDMIVRLPGTAGQLPVPTGVVSKRYVLVQHHEVLDAVGAALSEAGIPPLELPGRLTLNESGARMALRIELPGRFSFEPPDRHPMALTFECFNSVDRTVPLFAVLGWLRFVCANGLVVGTAQARIRQQHRPSLDIGDLEPLLTHGLADAERDRDALAGLMKRRVTAEAVRRWVDGPVAKAWGPTAAARVSAIALQGVDGQPGQPSRSVPPHARTILRPIRVPGAPAPCDNAYALAQALSWVASRRRNVGEQMVWRSRIPELVGQV